MNNINFASKSLIIICSIAIASAIDIFLSIDRANAKPTMFESIDGNKEDTKPRRNRVIDRKTGERGQLQGNITALSTEIDSNNNVTCDRIEVYLTTTKGAAPAISEKTTATGRDLASGCSYKIDYVGTKKAGIVDWFSISASSPKIGALYWNKQEAIQEIPNTFNIFMKLEKPRENKLPDYPGTSK